jgi:hypothetical protein
MTELSDTSMADIKETAQQRDQACQAHIRVLYFLLRNHKQRKPDARILELHAAATELEAAIVSFDKSMLGFGMGLTAQLYLQSIRSEIETLDVWLLQLGRLQSELDDLKQHGQFRPSLTNLHWLRHIAEEEKAKWQDTKRQTPDAEEEAKEAKDLFQAADRKYREECTRVCKIGAAHFPEIFRELGVGMRTEDFGSNDLFLPGRSISHYTILERLSSTGAVHNVLKAEFAGEVCVLKEYANDVKQQRHLRREARLLHHLGSSHPCIAKVESVFECRIDGRSMAYMQMPYYCGGDLLKWINAHRGEGEDVGGASALDSKLRDVFTEVVR